MEYLPQFALACLVGVGVLGALWWINRNKVRTVTTETLLKVAQDAVAEAQKLADMRAHAIESDQAALAADIARIAAARARLAGNVPAAS